MTRSRWFWIAFAVVTYPAMVLGGCLLAIMPPINVLLVPPWLMMSMCAVGAVSNRIAEASGSAALAKRARRAARPADEGLVEGALVTKA